jgi:hypothetical protein
MLIANLSRCNAFPEALSRLLSWRRHQGTMLNKNCILILPVSDPAKQAAQVVKHHVFDERRGGMLIANLSRCNAFPEALSLGVCCR